MSVFSFTVPGPPKPLGRPRTVRTSRGGVVTYTPKESRAYEETVRLIALSERPRSWPLVATYALTVRVFWPDQRRRDLDNLVKGCADAILNVAYDDDSRIVELHAYAEIDRDKPRIEVEVRVMP